MNVVIQIPRSGHAGVGIPISEVSESSTFPERPISGLKPAVIFWIYAVVPTAASLRNDFFSFLIIFVFCRLYRAN